MKNILLITVAVLSILASSVSSHAYSVGDWVLGNYQGANYWFAGVISDVNKTGVSIRYDDGDLETVTLDRVRPYDWTVGSMVECNFKSSGRWYAGKITGLSGGNLAIAYDGGDKEQTKTALCRSN